MAKKKMRAAQAFRRRAAGSVAKSEPIERPQLQEVPNAPAPAPEVAVAPAKPTKPPRVVDQMTATRTNRDGARVEGE